MPVRRLITARRPSLIVNGLLGLAVLAAAAWGYFSFFASSTPTATASTRTVAVVRGTVTASVTASGSLASATTAAPTFATSGIVTEINVKVGDKVKKGAVLAKVDDTTARRQLTAARSNLAAAEDALDRAGAAGDSTTSAQAQVTEAELDVEEAQQAVDGTVLTAPMAGTVVAVNGSVGGSSGSSGGSSSGGSSGSSSGGSGSSSGGSSGSSSGSSGSSSGFIQIQDLTELQVSAAFAEADATKLKPGLAATVTWNALPDATADAKVASIDPNATTSNGVVTYGVVLSLDQLPEDARPGQTVQVTVTVGTVEDAVAVNAVAVSGTGNRHTVTVLENGQQVSRQVQVGLEGDQLVEITSGLEVGDQVVLPTSSTSTNNTNSRNFPGGGGLTGGGLTGGGGPAGGGFSGGGRRG